MAKGSRNM